MYCKEQLRGEAAVEFSFEELRAQLYFNGKKRKVEERLAQVEQEKERLKEMLIRRSQKEVAARPAPLHPSQVLSLRAGVTPHSDIPPFRL